MAKKKIDKGFNPLVSIVIPVYNGSNYVREAIDSALAQTYKNIEIIVVNDGSTDNSEEIIKSYGNKLRYFKKENGGVSTALNLGIKKAKGEYISWLSHDDLYYPNKIERQIEEFGLMNEQQRGNSIVFCHFDALVMSTGKIINDFEKILPWSDYNSDYRFSMLDCFFSSKLNGCTLLFPKKIFNKFGFFDDTKRTIQDYLLFINFLKNGIRYVYVDEILITSRHHENQDTHKKIDLHISELNFLYKYTFDLFKDEFSLMPMWQFDHFLDIIKRRKLERVYNYMLSGWSSVSSRRKNIIWMYWENKDYHSTPDYIRLCWKSIISHNRNDFVINILSDDDIQYFLPEIDQRYKKLSEIAHRADYIRFKLLYKYGGIWLDSDFVAFRSLSPVIDKLKNNDFVSMGYKQKNGKFFPLIGFLAANPGNQICKKVISNIEGFFDLLDKKNKQPRWDEIGGYNLAKFIQSDLYYKYDSSYFCPYEVQFNGWSNNHTYQNVDFISDILTKNRFAFGQNIANSVLSDELKNKTEREILISQDFIGRLLRFGNSFEYFEIKNRFSLASFLKFETKKFFCFESRFLKRKIKDYILISFYKVDKIFPKKIRVVVKKNVFKFNFLKRYLQK